MERLPATLERLQDSGYALKDIAILVRTNQEGALVADTLLAYKEEHPSDRYNYDIISDDALFVGSSPAVRFLIAVLALFAKSGGPDEQEIGDVCLSSINRKIWGERRRTSLFFKTFSLSPGNPCTR